MENKHRFPSGDPYSNPSPLPLKMQSSISHLNTDHFFFWKQVNILHDHTNAANPPHPWSTKWIQYEIRSFHPLQVTCPIQSFLKRTYNVLPQWVNIRIKFFQLSTNFAFRLQPSAIRHGLLSTLDFQLSTNSPHLTSWHFKIPSVNFIYHEKRVSSFGAFLRF
jgi:hypothetical protein